MMDGFPAGQRMKITATTGGIVFQHPLGQKAGKKKKVNFMRFVYRVGEWRWGWLRTSVCLRATFHFPRSIYSFIEHKGMDSLHSAPATVVR